MMQLGINETVITYIYIYLYLLNLTSSFFKQTHFTQNKMQNFSKSVLKKNLFSFDY